MIRLLLVEDQEVVREGLKALLEIKPDLEVVAEASNGQQALEQVELLHTQNLLPDVILMDIRMPIMDGVTATQLICQKFPCIKILIFTTFNDGKYVAEALRFGAKGYLLKDTPSQELAEVIRSIYRGYSQFSPGVLEKIVANVPTSQIPQTSNLPSGFDKLSPRERQVLRMIANGASNREISQTLSLSDGTVRNHISHILTKLNLRDRTQASIVANSFVSWLEIEL
ncbi:MAG TPA: response regulator transcription factor [Leptolyngbyaceae cyanobacterium]